MIEAIETIYSGVRYRSRLEATWARHFDVIGLPHAYEPETIFLSNGERYIPDFWLPTARAWAEVKGKHDERWIKPEIFALDLWKKSGADNAITDHRAPMVLKLVGLDYENDHPMIDWAPGPLNILGIGKAGSAVFTVCPVCDQTTVVALWQDWCRNCNSEGIHPDRWIDNEFRLLDVPFVWITQELPRRV